MNGSSSPTNHQALVKELWKDQARWSKTAGQLKKELTNWRLYATIAGITGAVIETTAGTIAAAFNPELRILAGVIALLGAIILATVPFILRNKASKEKISEWVRARSVSEALKELIYKYLIKVNYSASQQDLQELIDETEAVKEKVKDLTIYCVDIPEVPASRPLTLTVDQYITLRVDDQIEGYYRRKGKEKAKAAKRLHTFEFILGFLAVILGVVAGFPAFTENFSFSFLGPWVAVVTTIAGAVTAHMAAMRYDHEAIIFFSTADRLSSLKKKWLLLSGTMNTDTINKFVDDCEHAISTENESWLAKWAEEEKKT